MSWAGRRQTERLTYEQSGRGYPSTSAAVPPDGQALWCGLLRARIRRSTCLTSAITRRLLSSVLTSRYREAPDRGPASSGFRTPSGSETTFASRRIALRPPATSDSRRISTRAEACAACLRRFRRRGLAAALPTTTSRQRDGGSTSARTAPVASALSGSAWVVAL